MKNHKQRRTFKEVMSNDGNTKITFRIATLASLLSIFGGGIYGFASMNTRMIARQDAADIRMTSIEDKWAQDLMLEKSAREAADKMLLSQVEEIASEQLELKIKITEFESSQEDIQVGLARVETNTLWLIEYVKSNN